MSANLNIRTRIANSPFVSLIKRWLRYRHLLVVWFFRLFCVEETIYQVDGSLEAIADIPSCQDIEFPPIASFGSSEVIDRLKIAPMQLAVTRQIMKLSNAHIVGPYGLLLNRHRQLLTHRIGGVSCIALRSPHLIWRSLFASLLKPTRHYPEIYTTHCTNTSNYFHWVLEFLAGLSGYDTLVTMKGRQIPILLQKPYTDRQHRWLDLLGYPYIEIEDKWAAHSTADVVYFSTNEFTTYCNLDKASCDWLRTKFLSNVDISQAQGETASTIYVNRKDSNKCRGVNNISEVETALISQGYVSITVSDYSVDEQILLFNNADIVVGEHGAGLTNVLFCENCHIVEIFPHNYHNNDIAVLALHAGNSYSPVFGYGESGNSAANQVLVEDVLSAIAVGTN